MALRERSVSGLDGEGVVSESETELRANAKGSSERQHFDGLGSFETQDEGLRVQATGEVAQQS